MGKYIFTIAILIISLTIFLKDYLVNLTTDTKINTAVKLIDRQTDSALKELNSINPSEIKSEQQFARYALYLTQARLINHIDETSDSLINIAVNYYDTNPSSNPHDRMLAHYYSGIIQINANNYSDAITNFIKVAHLAEEQNQPLWLGRAQSEIAGIYSQFIASSEIVRPDSLAWEIGHNVYNVVVKYQRNEIESMMLAHQNDVLRLTGLIILIISGGIVTIAFVNLSRKMQKQKDEQIISLADQLESILTERKAKQTINEISPTSANNQSENKPHFSISRKHLDTIRLLCETYYESNQKESIKSKTAKSVEQEIKDFVSTPDFPAFLDSLSNNEYKDLMDRFRTQMPGLTNNEYHIFVCSSLKLPVPAILMFFKLNRNTLYTIRRRLRQKISTAHPIDEHEFLSHL